MQQGDTDQDLQQPTAPSGDVTHPPFVFTPQSEQPKSVTKRKKRLVIIMSIGSGIILLLLAAFVTNFAFNWWDDHQKYSNLTGNKGWSVSEATTAWEAINGIDKAVIRLYEWESNPYKNTLGGTEKDSGRQAVLEIAVNENFHVTDGAAFLRSAAETLWALNDLQADSRSPLAIYIHGGFPELYNWGLVYVDSNLRRVDSLTVQYESAYKLSAGLATAPDKSTITGA